MPRYNVVVVEEVITKYFFDDLEASSPEQAEELVRSGNPKHDYEKISCGEIVEVEVTQVEEN